MKNFRFALMAMVMISGCVGTSPVAPVRVVQIHVTAGVPPAELVP